jgi:hypothetical protein
MLKESEGIGIGLVKQKYLITLKDKTSLEYN